MEGEKYRCQGCGSEIPSTYIDFKTRHAKCPWCGLEITFPKRHSTASPNAQVAIDEAYKLFMEGSYDSSLKCAETALSMVNTSAVSTFIIDYYKSYIAKDKVSKIIDNFFREKLETMEFEIEEEEMFKKLLLKKGGNTIYFEENILKKFEEYDDAKELEEFVEKFSPISISRKNSFDWLTPSMIEVYKKITKRVAIPKTWHALYLSMFKNPESPLENGTFFLKSKSIRIYNEVIIPIGDIFNLIQNDETREKFLKAYQKIKTVYEEKMKQ